jgi:hypothetical protein
MRTALWIAVLSVILVYLAVAYVTLDRRSDLAQIDALVARGTEAVQHRDVTAVVSCVSPNYNDDAGMNYDRLRIMLAQAMRNEPNYIVTTSDQVIRTGADGATVTLHVTLKRPIGLVFYDRDLTLELAKEKAYHMLILPTSQWRLVGTKNLGLPTAEAGF